MREECTGKHLQTLRHRYGEKRLREAARRRAHLNYKSIPIGDGPGSGRVKLLLAQMHQNYYFGFAESACILAGTILEQGLISLLEDRLETHGPCPYIRGGEKRWMQGRNDLLELELIDMLDLARQEGIIAGGRTLLLAHEIRWIRNMVVHEKVPLFRERDEKFIEMTVTKNRKGRIRYAKVLLEKMEADELGGGLLREGSGVYSAETTAYFCVSRTRMILRDIFRQRETEVRSSDEGGGSFLLWQET
jgi:hypothetical protein